MNLILFLLMLFPSIAFAALPETGVIEIRQSATAGNVNGCGFNAARGGTDYTLQDAAQLTNTDLSTSGAGATTVTSAGGGFTSQMVGNYIHITAGTNFQAGWYEITTFTDANNVVVDRTPSSGAAGSGGTFYVGGACSLNSTLDDDLFELAVATAGVEATIFYIKYSASEYSLGENISMSVSGTTTHKIQIIGYNTTRGDNPTGNDRPKINVAAGTITLSSFYIKMKNFILTGTGSGVLIPGGYGIIENVKVENTSSSAGRTAFSGGNAMVYINNEALSYRGSAFGGAGIQGVYIGNYAHHSNVCMATANGTNQSDHIFNVINSCTSHGISQTSTATAGRSFVYGNTFFGGISDKRGVGVYMTTNATNVYVINNIIYGFATGVEHVTANTSNYDNYNNYYNNTADVSDATEWQKGDADLAVDPQFNSILEVTGTTGAFAAGGSKLIDTSKDFTALGVTAGDYLLITGGTGAPTAYWYKIDSISTTTNANDTLNVTIPASPGTNTTADKTYVVSGQNNDFRIGNSSLVGAGWPGTIDSDKNQVGYLDIGALQKQVTGGAGGSFTFVQ